MYSGQLHQSPGGISTPQTETTSPDRCDRFAPTARVDMIERNHLLMAAALAGLKLEEVEPLRPVVERYDKPKEPAGRFDDYSVQAESAA